MEEVPMGGALRSRRFSCVMPSLSASGGKRQRFKTSVVEIWEELLNDCLFGYTIDDVLVEENLSTLRPMKNDGRIYLDAHGSITQEAQGGDNRVIESFQLLGSPIVPH